MRYVGLGFEIAVPLLIGVWIGYRVDIWLDTKPWFLLLGSLLGMAAGFSSFFRVVLPRKADRDGRRH